jgi:hypothetical protein
MHATALTESATPGAPDAGAHSIGWCADEQNHRGNENVVLGVRSQREGLVGTMRVIQARCCLGPKARLIACKADVQSGSKGIWLDERTERSKRKYDSLSVRSEHTIRACAPPLQHRRNRMQECPLLLHDVRVVIVSPKHAANVGAAVRACDNFEVRSPRQLQRCAIGT